MKEMYKKTLQLLLIQSGVLFDIYVGLEDRLDSGEVSLEEIEAHLNNIENIRKSLKDLYEDENFKPLIKEMDQDLSQMVMDVEKIFTELYCAFQEESEELKVELKINIPNHQNVNNLLLEEVEKLSSAIPWELKIFKE